MPSPESILDSLLGGDGSEILIREITERIMQLIPEGVLRTDEASNNYRVKRVIAGAIVALLIGLDNFRENETYPGTATDLLSDWEALLNLAPPDLGDLAARRAAILAKLTEDGGMTVSDIDALFALCGFDYLITTTPRLRAGSPSDNGPALNDTWAFYKRICINPSTDTLTPDWDCPDEKVADRFPAHILTDLDKGGNIRSRYAADSGVTTSGGSGTSVTAVADLEVADQDLAPGAGGAPTWFSISSGWNEEHSFIRFDAATESLEGPAHLAPGVETVISEDYVYTLCTFINRSNPVGYHTIWEIKDNDGSDVFLRVQTLTGSSLVLRVGAFNVETLIDIRPDRPTTLEFIYSATLSDGAPGYSYRVLQDYRIIEGSAAVAVPVIGDSPRLFIGGDATFDLLRMIVMGADGRTFNGCDVDVWWEDTRETYHHGVFWTEYDLAAGVSTGGAPLQVTDIVNQRSAGDCEGDEVADLAPLYIADLYSGNPAARFASGLLLESKDDMKNHLSERAQYVCIAFVGRTNGSTGPIVECTSPEPTEPAFLLGWDPSSEEVIVQAGTQELRLAVPADTVAIVEATIQDGEVQIKAEYGSGFWYAYASGWLTVAFEDPQALRIGGGDAEFDLLFMYAGGADGETPALSLRTSKFNALDARFGSGTAA